MTRFRDILKEHHETGAMNALVNVHTAIDDYTFLTKSGDLLMVLSARGVDYECLDPAQLDQLARRFESTIRIFDENFRIYQYLLKRDGPSLPIVSMTIRLFRRRLRTGSPTSRGRRTASTRSRPTSPWPIRDGNRLKLTPWRSSSKVPLPGSGSGYRARLGSPSWNGSSIGQTKFSRTRS